MIPHVDYHMHTPLCGHASGEPEEYVQQAIRIGLKEIGFSDHAPMVHRRDPGITMGREQLPLYHQMILDVQKKFSHAISIKVGLETDYVPNFETQTKEIVEGFTYDYVIGSVHYIDEWGFDDPAERERWDRQDIEQVYRSYFSLLRKSALSGMFDYMAHVDLVKKFGHRPQGDVLDEVKKTADVFKETGMVIEINTAGLRKPVGEMYPSLAHLKIYRQAGVPLTFGSDAHQPDHVGKDFQTAKELALAAGYQEYVSLTKRNIGKTFGLLSDQ
ncbi:MAG: histidinol-phosphatase HisJ [Candidatus Omnitrophica bacterium]|nr:histidinol-phosphatase HisJ [Candidatus Omnitrophota bacterium]